MPEPTEVCALCGVDRTTVAPRAVVEERLRALGLREPWRVPVAATIEGRVCRRHS